MFSPSGTRPKTGERFVVIEQPKFRTVREYLVVDWYGFDRQCNFAPTSYIDEK